MFLNKTYLSRLLNRNIRTMSELSLEQEETFEAEEADPEPIGDYEGDRNCLNERHGTGWALFLNGDQYEGDYRHQQRHGEGTYVFANGSRYIGEWVAGHKHGRGKFHYPDGSSYDGEWKKNLRQGFGVYTYVNGNSYEGNWYRNLKHGIGTYRHVTEQLTVKSVWHYGISKGAVEVKHSAMHYYGSWADQTLCGEGVFVFDAKYMAIGHWYTPPLPTRLWGEEEGGEEEESEIPDQKPPAVWKVRSIRKFDFSQLPAEPVPPPFVDSDNEDLCPAGSGSEEEYVEDIGPPIDLEETMPEDDYVEEEQLIAM